MGSRTRTAPFAAALVIVCLAAACSSTNEASTTTKDNGSNIASQQPTSAAPAGAKGGLSTSKASIGYAGGVTIRPSGNQMLPGSTIQNGVLQGVGVTPTGISIGIDYTTNGDKANAALGATGISQGDP
jgi:hypothetical protein